MADNTTLNIGAGGDIIADKAVTHAGATAKVQAVSLMLISGTTGSFSAVDVNTTNPIPISDAGGLISIDDGGGSITVDNAGTFAVQATLAAETTKVIGTVNLSAAQTLATVTTVSAVTSITNVVHVDDNAGSLTVDNGGTFAVQATLSAETVKVIGTVNLSAAQTLATVTTVGAVTTITNVVHVDDNAGSLTVDNAGTFAVQAAQSGNWPVRAQDGSGNALTSKSAGAERALSIAIIDGSGNQITSFGGGTQFAEDVSATSGDIGTVALAVRQDTISNSTSTDGDYGTLKLNSVGRLYTSATIDAALPAGANAIGKLSSNSGVTIGAVEIAAAQTLATVTTVSTVTNVATIGTSVTPGTSAAHLGKAEDAAHSSGDTGVFILGVQQTANTSLVGTDLDYAPFQLDANGNLKVAIITGAGSGGTAQTDGATYTASTTSGTPIMGARDDTSPGTLAEDKVGIIRATTNRALHVNLRDSSGNELSVGGGTQFAEDAAATSGDIGTVSLAVRQDTISSSTSTDGDYGTLKLNSVGRLYVAATVDAALPTGANVIGAVTQSGTWNVGTVTTITNVVHVDDNAGNLSIDDGGNSITVDNTGTFAVQATIAAGTTTIGKAEDAASADADVGVPAMAVRKATPANTSGTDGDYEFLQISAGRLWASATIDAAIPAGANVIGALTANQSVNVAQLAGTTTDTNSGSKSAGTLRVVIATDQPALTNPLVVDTELPSAAALADGAANPTAPAVGAFAMGWNGSTWDRVKSVVSASGNAGSVSTTWTMTDVSMQGTLAIQAASWGTATVIIEGAADGSTTFNTLNLINPITGAITTAITAAGFFQIDIAGMSQVRARCTAFTSGTNTVSGRTSTAQAVVNLGNSLPAGTSVIGALSANQSTNVAQLAGTTTDTNSGSKSAGTLRVVLATDQPALTNKLLVTPDSVALPANQSVNVAQINGVTPLMGTGASGTGSHRVTIATDGQGQLVDNAAFTDGTTRLDMAGFIFDETAGTALTENDAAAGRIDSKRAIVIALEDATTRGQRQAVSAAGAAAVNIAQVNGNTALAGNGVTGTGSPRVTIASDNTPFTVSTQAVPGSAPGTTTSRVKSAASTNATNLKASAGVFLGYDLSNNTASDKYVKLYNKATSPTVGTDTPFYTILVPKNGGRVADWSAAGGLVMGTGIGYGISGAITDADTTATAADDVHGMMLWK